jgi:hypothetical protein
MNAMRGCWVLPLLVACSSSTAPSPLRAVEIRLGDCAPLGTTWVTGPRPQPFAALDRHPTSDPHGGRSAEPEYNPIFGEPMDSPGGGFGVGSNQDQYPGSLLETKLADCIATAKGYGTISFLVMVDPDGSLRLGTLRVGSNQTLAACVKTKLDTLRLAKPKSGRTTPLSVSFTYGTPPPPAPPAEHVLDAGYHPGGASPLQLAVTELGRCFALAHESGGAVIELGRGDPLARDVSPGVAACVAKLTLRAPPMACSLAFGTQTAGELPGVTIDSGDVVMPQSPTRSPFAIRPAPQTPMKVVRRALEDAHVAGFDPVLAAKRGTAWQLVASIPLPVVPTPGVTGGQWSHAYYPPPANPLPWLEVQVTSTGITFTEAGKLQELGRDQLGQLASRLTAMRAQGDRIVTVSAHDDVTYNRVVEILDQLTAAGFTEWSVK